MSLPDWFEEMMDDAREFEESGEFDAWLASVPEDSALSDRLSEMGF